MVSVLCSNRPNIHPSSTSTATHQRKPTKSSAAVDYSFNTGFIVGTVAKLRHHSGDGLGLDMRQTLLGRIRLGSHGRQQLLLGQGRDVILDGALALLADRTEQVARGLDFDVRQALLLLLARADRILQGMGLS